MQAIIFIPQQPPHKQIIEQLIAYCARTALDVSNSDNFAIDHALTRALRMQEPFALCCISMRDITSTLFDKRVPKLYEKLLAGIMTIHCVSDNHIITHELTDEQKITFGIMFNLGSVYANALSNVIKQTREQQLRSGIWPSKAPYGYKNVRDDDGNPTIMVDDYKADIVTYCFTAYATGTYSLSTLCTQVHTLYGVVFAKSFLDALLSNPFYSGVMRTNGTDYPHRYPPLIAPHIFEEVQKMKQISTQRNVNNFSTQSIYRGMLRCAECNLAVTPEKHKGRVYYHCTQFNGSHDAPWLREEEITEHFGAVFKQLRMAPALARSIAATMREVHEAKITFHAKQFQTLTSEHTTVTAMMDTLYMDKLKGAITADSYDRFYTQFKQQLTAIESNLARLQEAEHAYAISAQRIVDLTERAYELFMAADAQEKRQLIAFVLADIKVAGRALEYTVQKPFDVLVQ